MASRSETLVICFLVASLFFSGCIGSRKLEALVEEQPLTMKYHKGALLTGDISINLIWYGHFTPAQRAIIADFIASLSTTRKSPAAVADPSVAGWLNDLRKYFKNSKTRFPNLVLGEQVVDGEYSIGKSLKNTDLEKLAAKGAKKNAINVVLTAADVAVEGFCMSRCAVHSASPKLAAGGRFAFIWVGNPATQCPGQCAWPFYKPIYGPQTEPLIAPNGDVGADGMVINLASMMAATVTNPFGNGYFQGPKEAPLEAASACPGVYGKNAYPGYAGDLLTDKTTGASYNANGVNGRKYLLPALFDPKTSSCSTLV